MSVNKEKRKYVLTALAVLFCLGILTVGLTLGLRTSVGSEVTPSPTSSPAATTSPPNLKSAAGSYRFAAVASDGTECSTIGTNILAYGGSAVDAAIAAMLCVGVINTHSCGIGGGHFMTIYDTPRGGKNKEVKTIIAREMAPAAAYEEMYVNKTVDGRPASLRGGLAVGVPGEIKGFYEAWKIYGRLQWKDLFSQTITLCRQGYRISSPLGNTIYRYRTNIAKDPNLREVFMPNGTLVKTGDKLRRPKLADTLEAIARDPETFYNGSMANDISDDIAEYNGTITVEDLRNYTALVRPALNVTLVHGEYTVYGPQPPSSGVVYQYILNILKNFKFTPETFEADKILTYHRIIEAFKFAYAKRTSLGDIDHLGEDTVQLIKNMTDNRFAEETYGKINDSHTQDVLYYGPAYSQPLTAAGTAHLSVLAPDGAAVAITSTINTGFGALVRGRRTGIFFNNQMDDFSTPGHTNIYGFPPSKSNFIRPGKRPMSSMCPTIVLNKYGDVVHIVGASGGSRITTTSSFVSVHNLWLNKTLVDSVDQTRIHHQLVPNMIYRENGFPSDILDGLRDKGHVIRDRTGNLAVVNPISKDVPCKDIHHCIHAVSDRRKPAAPDGF